MKKLTLVSLCLALCTLLSACGSGVAMDNKTSAPARGEVYYSYAAEMDDAGTVMMEEVKAESLSYGSAATGGVVNTVEQKLVYTSHVGLETEEFEAANDSLHKTIASLGGIIVSENASNLDSVGYRALSMTVRIPQEHYDTFLTGLSENFNVASIRNTVDNMTERYYDNENRLRALRIQEERLFTMLEKAATVEEMLKIETRLCDVQYEIESLTNAQRTIDNDVKYATFYLNLNEVTKYTSPAPKTFGDRLGETVKDSGEGFAEFGESVLFGLIYFFPYAVIIGVITVIVVVSVKHKKKAKIESENKDEK